MYQIIDTFLVYDEFVILYIKSILFLKFVIEYTLISKGAFTMQEKIKKVINDLLQARIEYQQKIASEPNPQKRRLLKLPNILTLVRPYSLLAILPIAFGGYIEIALVLITLSALTDFFDGIVARKFNAQSEYGKKLDPICDKIFAIGLSLPVLAIFPTLILPTILLEVTIAGISVASEIRQNHPESTKLGKAKTWALGFELAAFYVYQVLLLHNISLPIFAIYPFMAVANGMQVATSIQYGYIDQKKQRKKNDNTVSFIIQEVKEESSKATLTHQEILEYQHLKETLLEQPAVEKDKTKTIGTL